MGQLKSVVHELAQKYVVPSAVTQLFEAQSPLALHDAPLPPSAVPLLEDVEPPVLPLLLPVPLLLEPPVVPVLDVKGGIPGPPAHVGAG
jgi:hypothetical protein